MLLACSYITGQPSTHALRLGPVFLDAHHADPQSFDVPNTRAIVTFYFGARVLPCRPSPVHACTPVTSGTPAALAVARSQQTGCRHGTKERALGAQGQQSFSSQSQVLSFPAHWRRVLVRRGSSAAVAARNITPLSPCPRACCERPLLKPSHDPGISFLEVTVPKATSRARGFCVLLPGRLYIPV